MEGKWEQKVSGLIQSCRGWLKDFRQRLKDRGLEKWLKRDNLIILVLTGVLVFIIALPMESGDSQGETGEDASAFDFQGAENTGGAQESGAWADNDTIDEDEYLAYLERRLTETLSQVAGVGRVQVMITLKSSREMVVERENPVSRATTNETDSQGGSRIISQVETGDSVVYRSEGTDSEPYVIKTLNPEIEGVLVVAQGAGNGTVNRTVTAIVQALFDVEAHKVSVVKMAE